MERVGFSIDGIDRVLGEGIYKKIPDELKIYCQTEFERINSVLSNGYITGFQFLMGDAQIVCGLSLNLIRDLAHELHPVSGRIWKAIRAYQEYDGPGTFNELGFDKVEMRLIRSSGTQHVRVYFKKSLEAEVEESITVLVSC